MRRLERGAGRRRDRRTGPGIRQPAPGNSGPRAGAAPAGALTHSAHPGGVGAPPGGTTASCQELADDRWAHFAPPAKARPDAGRRTPQQSAERRAGPRHGPVISGDPEIGPLARRATGCGVSAPAPVGALLPSIFRERKQAKGHPPPSRTGRRSFARALVIPGPSEARSPESIIMGEENGIQTDRRRQDGGYGFRARRYRAVPE